MRKVPLIAGEYYHLYNRGVDKRKIFQSHEDLSRFFQSMQEFNVLDPIGSIFENSFADNKSKKGDQLLNIVAYCLNPNHFHLLVKQTQDNGISEFMKRLSGGYTLYFNNKYARTGSLFEGKFKSVHIDSNTYLLHLSAYINLNNRLKGKKVEPSQSSWEEYLGREGNEGVCCPGLVLEQFKNRREYEKFALASLKDIVKRKELAREFVGLEL
ncbi:transposase [Candidatus Parcubacteria bacterium]|nr:transposase [Candidatus Parcubacteria bacterium]